MGNMRIETVRENGQQQFYLTDSSTSSFLFDDQGPLPPVATIEEAVDVGCRFHGITSPSTDVKSEYSDAFFRHIEEQCPMDLDLFVQLVGPIISNTSSTYMTLTQPERENLRILLDVISAKSKWDLTTINDISSASQLIEKIDWSALEELQSRVYPPRSDLELAILSGLTYVGHVHAMLNSMDSMAGSTA